MRNLPCDRVKNECRLSGIRKGYVFQSFARIRPVVISLYVVIYNE